VPRIVVMFLVIAVTLPFMGATLGRFSMKIFETIAGGALP
jgi:flagellar biosynthesis protein FliQ